MDFIIIAIGTLIALGIVPVTLMYYWEYKDKKQAMKTKIG